MLTVVGPPDQRSVTSGQPDAMGLPPQEHRWWCRTEDCSQDDENIAHRSIVSTVVVERHPKPDWVQVFTEEFYSRDRDGRFVCDDGGPMVLVQTHGRDGYDPQVLTTGEAELVASAINAHVGLLRTGTSPVEEAATLLVTALAHTGRNPWELRSTLLELLHQLVQAMAEVRRPVS